MRRTIFAAFFILLLGVTTPSVAQMRNQSSGETASVKLYDYGESGFSLNKFFDPQHFKMSHSFEFSSSSLGGGSSLAMYTNSMMWQFNQKLAARLDIAYAYSPFSDDRLRGFTGGNSNQVFIRNAELEFRPSESTRINLSFRQSPYGSYASPYGYGGSGYRGFRGSSFQATYGSDSRELFWNRRLR
jgi:hypothetical protein